MGMESGGRLCMKAVLAALAAVTLVFLLAVAYLCPQSVCSAGKMSPAGRGSRESMGGPLSFLSQPLRPDRRNKLSFDDMLGDDFEFDMKGSDVMVFLHIQKTGGTVFGRHLVQDLDLEKPCECQRGRKRCRCNRPNSNGSWWLFSRYSTGWKCGLHADWTELTACVDSAMDRTEKTTAKRRYFYVTLLREPVARFLSEFRHVQRGATWRGSRHWCGGRGPTREELPPCFNGSDWRDVTFQEFMGCPWNLAANRQTRMLADLSLVGCYNRTAVGAYERDLLMLTSAKDNLRRMAFFGLTEQQQRSQRLFERTFRLRFLRPFAQLNETRSAAAFGQVGSEELEAVKRLNHLDMQLYEYAKKLMDDRIRRLQATQDPPTLPDELPLPE